MTEPGRRPIVYAEFADYDRATGGYGYNARMGRELAGLGWSVSRLELPAGFPSPSPEARARIAALLARVPDGAIVMIDQVCLAPIADLAQSHAGRLKWVEIFHHPTVCDLPPGSGERAGVEANERRGLAAADLVLATSETTARTLRNDYGVAAGRIVTAPPGFERPGAPLPRPYRTPARLLTVGAVVPRKGYLTLADALAGVGAPKWRLHIVGNRERDPGHALALQRHIEALGLGDRVMLLGTLTDRALADEWAAADLYVSASAHEGYGMAIGEALLNGLPVIATAAGAVGEWLSPAAARLVPVGDARALGEAIRDVLASPAELRAMQQAALRAAAALPAWSDGARSLSLALSAAFG